MSKTEQLVEIVSDKESIGGQLVFPSGPLDERMVIQAMATMERQTTLWNALRIIVAESMIVLEIPHGSTMVPPITGVILRNLTGDAPVLDPRTLVAMRDDLNTARTEQGRFQAGFV